MSSQETPYEWDALRKLWHLCGCGLMVWLFFAYKTPSVIFIGRWSLTGLWSLIALGWFITIMLLLIDLRRLKHPEENKRIKKLPLYGRMLRQNELECFNASTYYLVGASFLITMHALGYCSELTLVMAILVLGVADPAAGLARYLWYKQGWRFERVFGLGIFILASALVMSGTAHYLNESLDPWRILAIGSFTAVIEAYTKNFVALARPLTRKVQKHLPKVWHKLYPDDNWSIQFSVFLASSLTATLG